MPLSVRRYPDVGAFLAAAGPFLARREAEHNLILGISSSLRDHPQLFSEPPSFHAVRDGDEIVLASLRTPPYNEVLSVADDMAAVDRLAQALDADLPGVTGPKEVAARFVEAWRDRTGHGARLQIAERVFRLERVKPPSRPPAGAWRHLERRDVDLVAAWLVAFAAEALPDDQPLPDPMATAERWVERIGRTGYLWEDEGEPVCLVGAGGETPTGIRIGPVYTPPEHRGRGYASALTAAASQDQLDRGRRFVFLFTNLANPTSNKIYQAIGYEPVIDVDQYRFAADA